MTTPNGRFMTQKKICLSMSDFHPESWTLMWSVSSILTGLLSFMTDRAAMLDEIVDYVKFLRLQVKVLSMSRLGGAGAVAQLVADVPLSAVEGEGIEGGTNNQQAWEKWSNDGIEQQVAKLMEEDVGVAMQFLQSKVSSRLADLEATLDAGIRHRNKALTSVGFHLAKWMNMVRRGKTVNDTLNMLNFDVTKKCLVGEGRCPIFAKTKICEQVAEAHKSKGAGHSSRRNRLSSENSGQFSKSAVDALLSSSSAPSPQSSETSSKIFFINCLSAIQQPLLGHEVAAEYVNSLGAMIDRHIHGLVQNEVDAILKKIWLVEQNVSLPRLSQQRVAVL